MNNIKDLEINIKNNNEIRKLLNLKFFKKQH